MVSVQTCRSICILVPFVAGCASSPKEAASQGLRSQAAPETSVVATSSPSAAVANAAATSTPTGAELSAASLEPAPNPVVDLGKRPANEAENSGQVCRQMLKPDTNSLITVCGTPAQWKKYREAEARQAEENLLRWQAGRF
jgi:hypothetical protein